MLIKVSRPIAAAVLACLALSAEANTYSATTKREVPLLVPGLYQKGAPIVAAPGIHTLAFDGIGMWVSNQSTNTLTRYDVVSNKVLTTITNLPQLNVRKVLYDGQYVWAFLNNDTKAYRFPLTGGTPVTVNAANGGGFGDGAVFDGDYIWMLDNSWNIWRITPYTATSQTPSIVKTSRTQIGLAGAMAFDGKSLWLNSDATGVGKYDPVADSVTFQSANLGGGWGPESIAFDGQYMWAVATATTPPSVTRINVTTNQAAPPIALNAGAEFIAFDGQYMWIACRDADTIQKIDVRTSAIAETIQLPVGTNPAGMAFDGKYMWVAGHSSGIIYKFFVRM